MEIVKTAKGMELLDKRLQFLVDGDSKEHQFFKDYFGALFAYSAARVPEISDQYFPLDDAMRTGYVWEYGPFEYWDLIGFEKGIALVEALGESLPKWVHDLKASGVESFYKYENGKKQYFNIQTKKFEVLPDEVLYVGDMVIDFQFALNVGMEFVFFDGNGINRLPVNLVNQIDTISCLTELMSYSRS